MRGRAALRAMLLAAVAGALTFTGGAEAQEVIRLHLSGGLASPAISGMANEWSSGWSLSGGKEDLLTRNLSVNQSYGLSSFQLDDGLNTGSLTLLSGMADVRGTLPVGPVAPYAFGSLGFVAALMEVNGASASLDPQLSWGYGLGLDFAPVPGLTVFAELRTIKTLAGDAYRPFHLGVSLGGWAELDGAEAAKPAAAPSSEALEAVAGTYALEQMFGQALPARREVGGASPCAGGGAMQSFQVTEGEIVLMRDGTAFVRGMTEAHCLLDDGRSATDRIPQDTRGTFTVSGTEVRLRLPDNPNMVLTLDPEAGTLSWDAAEAVWRRPAADAG